KPDEQLVLVERTIVLQLLGPINLLVVLNRPYEHIEAIPIPTLGVGDEPIVILVNPLPRLTQRVRAAHHKPLRPVYFHRQPTVLDGLLYGIGAGRLAPILASRITLSHPPKTTKIRSATGLPSS